MAGRPVDGVGRQNVTVGGSLGAAPSPAVAGGVMPAGAVVAERLVVVPRDRRCPMFGGRTGIGIGEWIEEAQSCIRARHLSTADQAFFLFDHLEGEAREEIKYRTSAERNDPAKILAILRELYGCTESYVTLQHAFFSRKQQEEETLLQFSLALMALMEPVKQNAPDGLLNADILLRDQFVEHVLDSALRRELKQYVRGHPTATLLDVRGEAIRWERQGFPGGARERSHSLPSTYGLQYRVYGGSRLTPPTAACSEFSELRELLKQQQEQINQLTQCIASLQTSLPQVRHPRPGSVVCHRCQQPGHFARECDGERVRARVNSVARPANVNQAEN